MVAAPLRSRSSSASGLFPSTQPSARPLDRLARLAAVTLDAVGVALFVSDGEESQLVGACGGADLVPWAAITSRALLAGERIRDQLDPDSALEAHPVSSPDGRSRAVLLLLRSTAPRDHGNTAGLDDVLESFAVELGARDEAARLRQVEGELCGSQARLCALTDLVSMGVGLLSMTGIVEEVNAIAADILGLGPDEAVGRHFVDFVAPDDRALAAAEFERRSGGDTTRREFDLRVVRPSEEVRLLRVAAFPVLHDGIVAGVYFSGRDVTDERGQEEQLRRAERLASVAPLLSGVCHELNNPLTSIKSFAELMLLDPRPPEDREALEIVQREATRAARIVTDLRLVARQTQEEHLKGAPVDLNELVCAVFGTHREAAETAKVTIRAELPPRLPSVFGVESQLERVVDQLLSNAIHALRDHPGERFIRVQTYACGEGVGLRVDDTGPGIAPEHVSKIFDPFWSTRTTGEGTGLGLSLVHSIIADHGGSIRVEGEWGRGATFIVELPLCDGPSAPVTERSVTVQAKRPLRVLVVDDEAPIRFSVMRYMQRRGHTVEEAEEGQRALALLDLVTNGEGFDIIVADLRMPGLGGEELYRRLRERGDGLERRLIFITGDAESPDAASMLAAAGAPVVLKPFDLAEIAQIVESHADFVRAEREDDAAGLVGPGGQSDSPKA